MDAGKYEEAIVAFTELGDYQDSAAKKDQAKAAMLDNEYNRAVSLMDAGKYDEAIATFTELGDYKDSESKVLEINYNKATALMDAGKQYEAAVAFGKAGGYSDARERSFALWDDIVKRDTVSAGKWHTVGLKSDCTVVAVGDKGDGRCEVSDWTDIVAVVTGGCHTVGLKSDGTVVAVGRNDDGQCEVSGWSNIKLPEKRS